MTHPRLVEFAKGQLAKGMPVPDIIAHLRGQKWEESVIDEVITAATAGTEPAAAVGTTPATAPQPSNGMLVKIALLLLAALIAAAAIAGFFGYQQYSRAKIIREKTKFVEFSGNITGQYLPGTADAGATAGNFRLFDFNGVVDSSQITEPRAAMKAILDPAGETITTLQTISSGTDARYIAATLLAAAGGSRLFGGADFRWGGDSVFIRPERTPWSSLAPDNLVSGLLGALIGPDLLSNPWVRVAVGKPDTGIGAEQQVTWALLFRPTDQVFGNSKELSFLGREDGGDIHGVPTEIHHYSLNGEWMTKHLREALRDSSADKNMAWLGQLQAMITGATPDTGSIGTLEVSDAEMSVWVGKPDTLPYRIVIKLDVKEGAKSPATLRLEGELTAAYGQPVKIELPPDSVGIEQIQKQLGALQGIGNSFR
ncbi:MAG: hypothetical protein IAE97_10625 [Chthoniobacterales bacterium]|nr:hypothetical protein [Chthoniobacterales bacterium]